MKGPVRIFLAMLYVAGIGLVYSFKFLVWGDQKLGGYLYGWLNPGREPSAHGDAHYSDWEELKKTVHARPDGWYLGYLNVDGFLGKKVCRVYSDPEVSLIGVAPPGTGKSNMAKIQAISLARRAVRDDVTIIDPHGDIRPATRQAFLDAGYREQYLNFEKPGVSDKYNPLSHIRWSDPLYVERDVKQLAALLIVKDEGEHGKHFTEFSQLVAAGIIAYKLRVTAGNAYLGDIAEVLISNQKERARVFDEMEAQGSAVEKAAVTAFRDAGERERGSFGTTMTRNMAIWLQGNFRHVTSAAGWTWEQTYIDAQPVVTYICAGSSDADGAAARLILGNAVNTRLQMWPTIRDAHSGAGPAQFPKEHRLLVDEVRLLGYCKGVVTAVTEGRKMGMRLMMWALSLRDVYDIYEKDASALINGCNHLIFGGGNEMSTYEDWSRALGEYTLENQGYSESDQGESHSRNQQARRLDKGFELRGMTDELVCLMRGHSVKLYKPFKIIGYGGNKRLEFI